VRREIRDLRNDYPDQWNLYLLGLATFQWTSQNDSLSYYGLASKFLCPKVRTIPHVNIDRIGIHGRPFRTWGNVPGIERKIGTAGYCPHSNALFLGWHRPYLALFEVIVDDEICSYLPY
jgi:tyrosinase